LAARRCRRRGPLRPEAGEAFRPAAGQFAGSRVPRSVRACRRVAWLGERSHMTDIEHVLQAGSGACVGRSAEGCSLRGSRAPVLLQHGQQKRQGDCRRASAGITGKNEKHPLSRDGWRRRGSGAAARLSIVGGRHRPWGWRVQLAGASQKLQLGVWATPSSPRFVQPPLGEGTSRSGGQRSQSSAGHWRARLVRTRAPGHRRAG